MTPIRRYTSEKIFAFAHKKYASDLCLYSSSKIKNPMLAEDLVQETFIRTWRYIADGGKIETMKSFLYRILNNLIVDEYRKHKTVSLDEMLENGFEITHNESDRIYDRFDGHIAILLISKLPKKYRLILRMRYENNLSLAEISALTRQQKNTTAVQLHRGLEKLKTIYSRNTQNNSLSRPFFISSQ